MSENPDDLSVLGFFYSQEEPKGSPIPAAEIGALEEKLEQQLTSMHKDFFRSQRATNLGELKAIETANPRVKIELELNDIRALIGCLRRLSQLEESEREFSFVRAYLQQAYKAFRAKGGTFRGRVTAALRLLWWTKGKKQSRYDALKVGLDYLSEVQKETEQERIGLCETSMKVILDRLSEAQKETEEDRHKLYETTWEEIRALSVESWTPEPTTEARWRAIETITKRYQFRSKQACYQFLKVNDVEGLPSTWPSAE